MHVTSGTMENVIRRIYIYIDAFVYRIDSRRLKRTVRYFETSIFPLKPKSIGQFSDPSQISNRNRQHFINTPENVRITSRQQRYYFRRSRRLLNAHLHLRSTLLCIQSHRLFTFHRQSLRHRRPVPRRGT